MDTSLPALRRHGGHPSALAPNACLGFKWLQRGGSAAQTQTLAQRIFLLAAKDVRSKGHCGKAKARSDGNTMLLLAPDLSTGYDRTLTQQAQRVLRLRLASGVELYGYVFVLQIVPRNGKKCLQKTSLSRHSYRYDLLIEIVQAD